MNVSFIQAWFPFGLFLPFIARFGFSYQQKAKTSNAMFKWKHLQKAKTSNQRHLPVLVFEIELIISQKQERATKGSKSNEQQMETRPKNQNEQQKTTKIFHSHFHSFASTLDLWKVAGIKSNEKPERATTGNEKQRKVLKSNEGQLKATKSKKSKKPKWAIKNQNEQRNAQKVQMEPSFRHKCDNVQQRDLKQEFYMHIFRLGYQIFTFHNDTRLFISEVIFESSSLPSLLGVSFKVRKSTIVKCFIVK